MTTSNKKTFVLDTNVLLHDFRSLYNFCDNDVVIPIVVLEELDKCKKGNDIINLQAREFMRELDKLTENNEDIINGVSLGQGRGNLFVLPGKTFSQSMKLSFSEPIPDHKIIATAIWIKETFPEKHVIMVSQDINLRMKARTLGLEAQDYNTGKVINTEKLFDGVREIETGTELINKLYNEDSVSAAEYCPDTDFTPNEYFIIQNNKQSVLCHFDPSENKIQKIDKVRAYGITPKNAEQSFVFDALMRPEIKLVTITGKAGTGKTLLALAAALEQHREFSQIFLSRPAVSLANKDLGFLPGNERDKMLPYIQPLFDNLNVIKQSVGQNSKAAQQIDAMLKEEKLLISPLAYIRGRSLQNSFFIVDESQNLTPHEIKTIITRAGEGTKMVFTGDVEQIDSPFLDMKSNGLSYLADKMKGQHLFAHINLVQGERSGLADLASKLLN